MSNKFFKHLGFGLIIFNLLFISVIVLTDLRLKTMSYAIISLFCGVILYCLANEDVKKGNI